VHISEWEREWVSVWEEGEWVQSGTCATTSRRGHRDIRLRVDDGIINYYYNAASTINLYNILHHIYLYIRTTKIYVITNSNIFPRLALFFSLINRFYTDYTCTLHRVHVWPFSSTRRRPMRLRVIYFLWYLIPINTIKLFKI